MNHVALVTGSTRGIGKAITVKFTQSGIKTVIHGSKDFDVSDQNSVTRGCAKILDKYGNIDILVNNAGINRDRTLLKMSFEEWDEVIKTNLYGTFYVTQAILPNMIKQKSGRIINISSIIGQNGAFGQTNYAAAKAGIIGFTKSLALEVAKYQITVNAVCPGFIDSEMTKTIPADILKTKLAQIPLGRLGKSEEIASIVDFLASEGSSYITGGIFNVDGGWQ